MEKSNEYKELIRQPELYSEVQNALIIGVSEVEIASEYDLDLKLVQEVKKHWQGTIKKAEDWTENKKLDDVLADVILENGRALKQIARQALDPGYTLNQKAGDLGTLYEKIGQFTIRLLEAAAEAKRNQ